MSGPNLSAQDIADIADALEYTAEDLGYRRDERHEYDDDTATVTAKIDRLNALIVSFAVPLRPNTSAGMRAGNARRKAVREGRMTTAEAWAAYPSVRAPKGDTE